MPGAGLSQGSRSCRWNIAAERRIVTAGQFPNGHCPWEERPGPPRSPEEGSKCKSLLRVDLVKGKHVVTENTR
jgi:hypothetical protein